MPQSKLHTTRIIIVLLLATLIITNCSKNPRPTIHPIPKGASGMASWYGPGFNGKQTASGERFNMNGISAAHKTLPFGTIVRVTNLKNGRKIEVRINDRGPFVKNRIIDLSKGAAKKLDMIAAGVIPVRLEIIKYGPQ